MVRARNQTSALMHSIEVSWEVPPPMHQRKMFLEHLPHYIIKYVNCLSLTSKSPHSVFEKLKNLKSIIYEKKTIYQKCHGNA